MKKVFAVLIILGVFTANAFAEYNFSFWGRGVFTPIAISGEDSSVSAATTTWGNNHGNGQRPRVGFTLAANNEGKRVGMIADFQWDGDNPAIGENAHIWVKPFGDIVKLTIGKFEIDDFRGRVGAVEFGSWILPGGVLDEDAIFMRFKSSAGAHLAVRPLAWLDSPWNGLAIEGAVGSTYTMDRAIRNIVGWSAADVYASMQAGLSYAIPNIGLFRFQFVGGDLPVHMDDYIFPGNNQTVILSEGLATSGDLNGKYRDADVIEAAFLYNGLENLKVDVGVKLPLKYNTNLTAYQYYDGVYTDGPYKTGSFANANDLDIQFPTAIAVGASYTWNDLSLLARGDFSFGGKYEHKGVRTITIGSDIGVMASASYRFHAPFRVGLDLAFNHHAFDTEEKPGGKEEKIGERATDMETSEHTDFGFAPWVSMDLGGGSIKIGVAVMIPSSERWSKITSSIPNDPGWRTPFTGDLIISFPISVTYSF